MGGKASKDKQPRKTSTAPPAAKPSASAQSKSFPKADSQGNKFIRNSDL